MTQIPHTNPLSPKTKPRDSMPNTPDVVEEVRRQAHDAPIAAVPPDSGTQQGQLDLFLGLHGNAVQALLCVCKADGYLRANERALILEYARSKGLRDPALVELLSRQISGWGCGKVQFWAAVKAYAAQGATPIELQALLELMRQLVLLDKKAHPDELSLLKHAAKTWKLPPINF